MERTPIVLLCHGNTAVHSDQQVVSVLNKLKKSGYSSVSCHFQTRITLQEFRKAKQDPKKIVTVDCGGGETNPKYDPKPTILADLTQPLTQLNSHQLVIVVHAPLDLEQNEEYQNNLQRLLSKQGIFVIVLSDRISKSYYTVNANFYHSIFQKLRSTGGWRGNWWHKTGFITFRK